MKKGQIAGVWGFIGIALLLGFFITGCNSTPGTTSAKVEKSITITDIPQNYIDKYGYAALVDSSNHSKGVATTLPKKISGATLTGNLITPSPVKPYTGSGSFIVLFNITETSDVNSTDLFVGMVLFAKITDEVSTFSFNDFIEMNDL